MLHQQMLDSMRAVTLFIIALLIVLVLMELKQLVLQDFMHLHNRLAAATALPTIHVLDQLFLVATMAPTCLHSLLNPALTVRPDISVKRIGSTISSYTQVLMHPPRVALTQNALKLPNAHPLQQLHEELTNIQVLEELIVKLPHQFTGSHQVQIGQNQE